MWCSALEYVIVDAMDVPVTQSVRARARAEMTAQIKQRARERLAQDGPDLSLRAVARDLGLVSSAVYRYFGSRDELLTALIVDAYNSLGVAAEAAESEVPRRDVLGRWMALGRGIRQWALQSPHEYALIYGSPVPGYAAPEHTIGPANRPVVVVLELVRDGLLRGDIAVFGGERLPRSVRVDLEGIARDLGYPEVLPPVLARTMTAWAQLFGAISFELFGRLQNAVHDYEAWFDCQLRAMAAHVGM
jgi:AcrR family transcriptional regulator